MLERLRWFVLLAFSASLAFWALGCDKPEPPTITAEKVVVTKSSAQGLDLEVTLNAKNPNAIKLQARSIKAKVTINTSTELADPACHGHLKGPHVLALHEQLFGADGVLVDVAPVGVRSVVAVTLDIIGQSVERTMSGVGGGVSAQRHVGEGQPGLDIALRVVDLDVVAASQDGDHGLAVHLFGGDPVGVARAAATGQ